MGGDAEAQFIMGTLLAKEIAKSKMWYERAAKQNHFKAQTALALIMEGEMNSGAANSKPLSIFRAFKQASSTWQQQHPISEADKKVSESDKKADEDVAEN